MMKTPDEWKQYLNQLSPDRIKVTSVSMEADSYCRTAIVRCESHLARQIAIVDGKRGRTWPQLIQSAFDAAVAKTARADAEAREERSHILPYFEPCEEHPDAEMRIEIGAKARRIYCDECRATLGEREVPA